MCMAFPMRIMEINGYEARCEARGAERLVNLSLLTGENLAVNDYIMVHAGCAASKITEEDARLTWEIIDEALALEQARA